MCCRNFKLPDFRRHPYSLRLLYLRIWLNFWPDLMSILCSSDRSGRLPNLYSEFDSNLFSLMHRMSIKLKSAEQSVCDNLKLRQFKCRVYDNNRMWIPLRLLHGKNVCILDFRSYSCYQPVGSCSHYLLTGIWHSDQSHKINQGQPQSSKVWTQTPWWNCVSV